MFQAKEEELTVQIDKIKGVREELKAFQEEHGIKLRYVKPQLTTHFMKRKASNLGEKPIDYPSLNKKMYQSKTRTTTTTRAGNPDKSCSQSR